MTRIVKDPHVRRQEIIEEAMRLFQEKGFEATSVQDVMKGLGIAKGTIYHYFKSKEELMEAVVEKIVLDDFEAKRALLESTAGTAMERLKVLVEHPSLASQNEELLSQLHRPANAGMHTRLLAVSLMKEAELYALIIRQGVEEGIFQTEHPLECAEFILSAVQFLTDAGIHPWTGEQLFRRANAFPSLIESVLKAAPGSFQFLMQRI